MALHDTACRLFTRCQSGDEPLEIVLVVIDVRGNSQELAAQADVHIVIRERLRKTRAVTITDMNAKYMWSPFRLRQRLKAQRL